MDQQEMIDLCRQHTLYTWAATGNVQPQTVLSLEFGGSSAGARTSP